MYRAVVLTSLVILLLAVVGVSVAQESRTFVGGPKSDNPPGSTTPERTSIETTGPEETTPSPLPGVSSETGNREDASELRALQGAFIKLKAMLGKHVSAPTLRIAKAPARA